MIPDVFLYRGYCLMEEKDNNTNELEELMLEEIDINEDSDESDDSQNLTDKNSAATRKILIMMTMMIHL